MGITAISICDHIVVPSLGLITLVTIDERIFVSLPDLYELADVRGMVVRAPRALRERLRCR